MIVDWAAWEAIAWAAAEGFFPLALLVDDFLVGMVVVCWCLWILIEFDEIDECGVYVY